MNKMEYSAIYEGVVRHRRLSPVFHHFSYRVFMMYLDLDEIDTVMSRSLLWSASRPALARFKRADYLDPQTASLKSAVHDYIFQQTGERMTGPVRLLTNLRYFGFLINPISCYYAFDAQERLRFVVAEVTNTPWGERIAYVIPCQPDSNSHLHSFSKQMHVSPFMPMDMTYQWRSNTPGQMLNLNLQNWRDGKQAFNASLSLKYKPATAANLNRALLSYPFMTAKVAAGIYWQALKLFFKGVRYQPHPPRSGQPGSSVSRARTETAAQAQINKT